MSWQHLELCPACLHGIVKVPTMCAMIRCSMCPFQVTDSDFMRHGDEAIQRAVGRIRLTIGFGHLGSHPEDVVHDWRRAKAVDYNTGTYARHP
jgi:hypothetical protein